jgi:PiT family inorganic phosphate transporter
MDQHTLLIGLVVVVVILALIFDFLNGFHDAANAIATIVITRTLTPGQAVMLAGIANFMGYLTITLGMGSAILKTVGKGVVNIGGFASPQEQLIVILASLSGAALWNIITWWLGLPTSSSHALIGGLAGSTMMAVATATKGMMVPFKVVAGGPPPPIIGLMYDKISLFGHTVYLLGVFKIMLFIIIAPLLGMLAASIFTSMVMWCFRKAKPARANIWFRNLQLVSASWYSFGHGMNDAQKTMAIIMMALIAWSPSVYSLDKPVHWVILSCYAAIGLGTMFGGWRIVKTMGTKITKIRAMEGFCAESAASLVLMGTAHYGIPVSTTHVISGAIMGVGAVEHAAKVRWVTARNILWAWILTIPLTAIFTAGVYLVLHHLVNGAG